MPSMVPPSKDQETHSHSLALSLCPALSLCLSQCLPLSFTLPLSRAFTLLQASRCIAVFATLSCRLIPLCPPPPLPCIQTVMTAGQEEHQEKEVQEEEEENSSGPETTTAATAALSFQHLFQAGCSSRSVNSMGTKEVTRFCILS